MKVDQGILQSMPLHLLQYTCIESVDEGLPRNAGYLVGMTVLVLSANTVWNTELHTKRVC